jgi:hypothetical protein
VSGRLEFEGSTRGAPETITSTSVNVEALDPRDAETRTGRVGADGRFVVSGVPAGRYLILHASSYALWSLKSVTIGGREMLGRALEIAGDLNNVVLTFTDRPTRLSGQVTDGSGIDAAAAVVVFPGAGFSLTDVTWNSGSPRFRLVRVGRNGQYLMAGLPPGPYYVAALSDEATDNWVDEAFLTGLSGSATPIQLNDGDQRTLDLRVVQVSR